MECKHTGKQTVRFDDPPVIGEAYSIVGYKEGEGPLGNEFDEVLSKDAYKELTWEKAESALQRDAMDGLMKKSGVGADAFQYILGGDLLNQCSGTHYGLRDTEIPFIGLFGACSTMTLAMSVAAMLIDGGFANRVATVTSSHFCSAEKQFRFPMEYGGQRPPSAQWTTTGAGALLLTGKGEGPRITHVTTGKMVDMGITDANNMGAAMAPAFCDTMENHFADTGRDPSYYDLILSGDLGKIGKTMATEMLAKNGLDLTRNYDDCGTMLFDMHAQDVHAGASGCGCSATVFCGHIFKKLRTKELKRILFCATGALMNPTAILQNESIPSIAHAVAIEAE